MCHVVKYNAKRLSSIVSIANTVFSILKYPHIYQRFHAVISLLNHASIPLFTVFYYYSKLISINLMTIPSSIIKRPLHVWCVSYLWVYNPMNMLYSVYILTYNSCIYVLYEYADYDNCLNLFSINLHIYYIQSLSL